MWKRSFRARDPAKTEVEDVKMKLSSVVVVVIVVVVAVVGGSGGCDVIAVVVLVVVTVPWGKWMSENFAWLCCIESVRKHPIPCWKTIRIQWNVQGIWTWCPKTWKTIIHSSKFDDLELYNKDWPWPTSFVHIFHKISQHAFCLSCCCMQTRFQKNAGEQGFQDPVHSHCGVKLDFFPPGPPGIDLLNLSQTGPRAVPARPEGRVFGCRMLEVKIGLSIGPRFG